MQFLGQKIEPTFKKSLKKCLKKLISESRREGDRHISVGKRNMEQA